MSADPEPIRKREKRDRPATEQAILDAFEAVLVREGVLGLGVNAVASEAGVNKVLIYRYFGDFPGLAKRWADESEIWPSALEMIGGDPESFAKLSVKQRVKVAMGNYMDTVRQRPILIELLAAELCYPGEISRVLEEAVAQPGTALNDYVRVSEGGEEFRERNARLIPVVNAVTAYMTIRERNNPKYLGLELGDETWNRLRETIDEIVERFLDDPE